MAWVADSEPNPSQGNMPKGTHSELSPFPVCYSPQGRHSRLRLAWICEAQIPPPPWGQLSFLLTLRSPAHPPPSSFLFVWFVLFSVNIYFLFWTCRDQLRFWSGGEGEDDWVFLFFPFSLGFWCLNLKKNNHKYIYKQMTYLKRNKLISFF